MPVGKPTEKAAGKFAATVQAEQKFVRFAGWSIAQVATEAAVAVAVAVEAKRMAAVDLRYLAEIVWTQLAVYPTSAEIAGRTVGAVVTKVSAEAVELASAAVGPEGTALKQRIVAFVETIAAAESFVAVGLRFESGTALPLAGLVGLRSIAGAGTDRAALVVAVQRPQVGWMAEVDRTEAAMSLQPTVWTTRSLVARYYAPIRPRPSQVAASLMIATLEYQLIGHAQHRVVMSEGAVVAMV